MLIISLQSLFDGMDCFAYIPGPCKSFGLQEVLVNEGASIARKAEEAEPDEDKVAKHSESLNAPSAELSACCVLLDSATQPCGDG